METLLRLKRQYVSTPSNSMAMAEGVPPDSTHALPTVLPAARSKSSVNEHTTWARASGVENVVAMSASTAQAQRERQHTRERTDRVPAVTWNERVPGVIFFPPRFFPVSYRGQPGVIPLSGDDGDECASVPFSDRPSKWRMASPRSSTQATDTAFAPSPPLGKTSIKQDTESSVR